MPYQFDKCMEKIEDEGIVRQIIANAKYAVVSLCKDNRPYLVTLSYGYDEEHKIFYFHCGKNGKKNDFIEANHYCCIQILEDWGYVVGQYQHTYRSIVAFGMIEVLTDIADKEKGFRQILTHLEESPHMVYKKLENENQDLLEESVILRFTPKEMSARRGK